MSFKLKQETSKFLEDVVLVRAVSLLGGIVYPLWSLVYQAVDPNVKDPISFRLPMTLIAFVIFISTYSSFTKRYLTSLIYFGMSAMIVQLIWIAHLNQFSYIYQIGIIVLICATLPFYQSLLSLSWYIGVTALCVVTSTVYLQSEQLLLLYMGCGTVFFVSVCALINRLMLTDKLQKSRLEIAEAAERIAVVHRDIKAIMVNIKQGIFTIDTAEGTIGDQYSDFLPVIFGFVPGKNTRLVDFFQNSEISMDQREALKLVGDCLNRSVRDFEKIKGELPQLVIHNPLDQNSRHLELEWSAVLDSEMLCVKKILVTVRDVTEYNKLKKENQLQNEKLELQKQVIQLEEMLKDERDARHAMAEKAAHHLNNPLQAMRGLVEVHGYESKMLRKKLDPMLPSEADRSDEDKQVINSLLGSFDLIAQNAQKLEKSITRAMTIANELRVFSGIHGLNLERFTLAKLWDSLTFELQEDEALNSKSIKMERLAHADGEVVIYIDGVSLVKSVFYVWKEVLQDIPGTDPIAISASLRGNESEKTLGILMKTDQIKWDSKKEWRELKFCQHLLKRFGVNVVLETRPGGIMMSISFPQNLKDSDVSAYAS